MSEKFAKLLIIPTDNRPVSYDLPLNTANLIKSAQVALPPKELLSSLSTEGDYEGLKNWLKNILSEQNFDMMVVSLDTIAYGGLIPSRRTTLKFDEIKQRIFDFVGIINNLENKPKIYAFSSIMRISNSNINEEEKSYWDKYGKLIYEFSYLSHRMLAEYDEENEQKVTKQVREIPFEVIDDYLNSRRRNFDVNLLYLDIAKKGFFEYLVFAQDDSAKYGFNVEEADLLNSYISKENLSENAAVKTGADELTTTLTARALGDFYDKTFSFQINFFKKDVSSIISRYEGLTIKEAILSQMDTCKVSSSADNPDVMFLVNAPNVSQDELCLNIFEDEKDNSQADKIIEYIQNNDKKYAVADIKYANGADNYLMEKLLNNINMSNFYGFGAWNTTSNTLGTVIATAKMKLLAESLGEFDENVFKNIILTRFLDDWAYQANVRQIIRAENNNSIAEEKIKPFENRIKESFNIAANVSYSFPWNRTFEIEIKI